MIKPICLDTETSIGTHKYHTQSRDKETDVYTLITARHPDDVFVEHREKGFSRTLPPNYFGDSNTLVLCNASFDLGYLWHDKQWQEFLSIESNTIWDVCEAEYILSGQRHKYPSLAELQEIYLGQKTKEDRISKLFKKGIGADRILSRRDECGRIFKLYETYCKDDGISTLKIFAAQYRRAKKEGCLKLIQSRMKGKLAIIMMENTGLRVDVIKCEKQLRDFRLKSLDYLQQAIKMTDEYWDARLGTFNINSPKHKSAMLFGGNFQFPKRVEDGLYKNGNQKYKTIQETIHIKGFDVDKKYTRPASRTGEYSTDEKVLNTIYDNSANKEAIEYCKMQKLAMRYSKMAETYLAAFINRNIDGVVVPTFTTTETKTSRLSAKNPNFQNVPKKDKELRIAISGQLVAPDGWKCISIDYSMLEIYVSAMLSLDQVLIDDLQAGLCLHCQACSWFPRLSQGKSYEEIYHLAKVMKDPEWDLLRSKAKGVNFKRFYGGGAKSTAALEELPVEDVIQMYQSVDAKYYTLKDFNDTLYNNLIPNQKLSRREHFSASSAAKRRFQHDIELLPIFDNAGKATYRSGEFRHYSGFTTILGHIFNFEEVGDIDKFGNLRRRYSTTETKNWHIQGTAGDIVQLALAECMYYVLKNKETVQLVRTIHDSIEFYVKNGYESLHIPELSAKLCGVKHLCKKYLEIEIPFDYEVEVEIGDNFGEMTSYEL